MKMKNFKTLILFLLILGLFWSCQKPRIGVRPITPTEIEAHIRFLSDDLLEGRAVGSRGLALAALYQENYLRSLGLEPVFGPSFRQPLVLRGSQPDKRASLEIFSDEVSLNYEIHEDFVVNTYREDCPEGVEGELVYCGYLIQAPERDWDDLKGADLSGKVLIVEVNEPGNYPEGIFDGEDMTYYGRWTYKFEKASELGATGVLIIHNSKGASYGWEVVQNSWSGESFFLPDKENRLYLQGWLHERAAEMALQAAGYEREEFVEQAEKPDFKPVPLGLKARVRQKPTFRSVATENVAGLLRGKHKKFKNRQVILSAHFDHLGRDTSREGDQVYNGAVDNCSATAVMLALARYYGQQPESLKVNLVFLAATAEEEGLLGSDYFARHLPFPESSVLANLNFELTNVWGETGDVYAIGAKHSDLEDYCRKAAENLGLDYIPEREGNFGWFFRSDQLSFVRAGIPAIWLHEGITSEGESKDHILKKRDEYQKYKYHQVSDEIEKDWDLKGAVQIARWAQEIIDLLSEAEELPRFKETSSFRRKKP
jgi:Zn-dependent M28 family amino/carboxypeptidase